MIRVITGILFTTFINYTVTAQKNVKIKTPSKQDTLNGSITPERIWWDIQHYALTIRPDYESKTITGKNTIRYNVPGKKHSALMQIDLVSPLKIDSVFQNRKKVAYRQDENIWYLAVSQKQSAANNEITIYYSGRPKESLRPPYDGGIVWAKDSLGRPWMSVACQYTGASVWYPCKNTMYDKADQGCSVTVITPDTLAGVANGRLQKQVENTDKTTSYTWVVKNPISHYSISFYIGKYTHISETYNGKRGKLSMDYYVLDYNRQKALSHMMPEVNNTIKSLEYWYGPYPFYEDGFKMVDAPYIGMEHQSAIAYGNNYIKGTNKKGGDISNTGWGKKTDKIIVHEIAHEWFGNNITAIDIADRWIQEGFAGLAEELVIADSWGKQAGTEFLAGRYRTIENDKPIIARYGINEDGSQDNYIKGWTIIHMVRTIINDNVKFRKILTGLNSHFYHSVITTKEMEDYICLEAGIDFTELFNQYLRTAQIPVLQYKISGNNLTYRFSNCNQNFTIPIKVSFLKDDWIVPTTFGQTLKLNSSGITDTLIVDQNFYMTAEKLESL